MLPPPLVAESSDDMDTQSRAVLAILVQRALAMDLGKLHEVPADPSKCPNCGDAADSLKSPYCSECCRSHAAFVRQMRSALTTGSIEDPDRQSGLGQAFWRELGGGHPHRRELLVDKAVARVLERDGGVCQVCGTPATTIDHVGSG